ncbi:MAG: four helix bundle protein [Elusimicrobia bacterium]|nr:four helix bundle protein [Elusimicrobiota bacterium]
MFDFEKLEVYQKAIIFANDIYNLTKKFPKTETFGVIDQLRRASVSISLNIAEGSGRTKKDFKHFAVMARTSVLECVPLLKISLLQKYITDNEEKNYYQKCEELSRMLCGLIRSL